MANKRGEGGMYILFRYPKFSSLGGEGGGGGVTFINNETCLIRPQYAF